MGLSGNRGAIGPRSGMPDEEEVQKALGYWKGGDKMRGRDYAAVALAALGDAFDPKGGNSVDSLIGRRSASLGEIQKQQQQAALLSAAQRQGINPDQVALMQGGLGAALPKPPTPNDTERDFNWYKGLSEEDRATYQQMRPQYRQGPDGQFYRIDVAPQPKALPSFSQDDWDSAGGGAGNGIGGFRVPSGNPLRRPW